mgnify:CR=1 FL=1
MPETPTTTRLHPWNRDFRWIDRTGPFRTLTAETDSPVTQTFVVSGIVDLGVRDLNRRTVYVAFRTAQTLLSLPGGASRPGPTARRSRRRAGTPAGRSARAALPA